MSWTKRQHRLAPKTHKAVYTKRMADFVGHNNKLTPEEYAAYRAAYPLDKPTYVATETVVHTATELAFGLLHNFTSELVWAPRKVCHCNTHIGQAFPQVLRYFAKEHSLMKND